MLSFWSVPRPNPEHYLPFSPSPSDPFLPAIASDSHLRRCRLGLIGRIPTRRAFAAAFVLAVLYISVHPHHIQKLSYGRFLTPDPVIATTCTPSGDPSLLLSDGDYFRFSNRSISGNSFIAVRPSPHPIPSKSDAPPKEPPEWNDAEVPLQCLDDYISLGKPCKLLTTQRLDVVWEWVNSSDPLFRETFMADRKFVWKTAPDYMRFPAIKTGTFREFDELRYSMRSMLRHFGDHTRTFWLIATDFKLPGCEGWRVGQIPQWLSPETGQNWNDGETLLRMVHHSNIFPPLGDISNYNPHAIESRLHHIPGLSKYFVHMNDDFFANNDLSNLDFYSAAFGPVFRLEVDLLVPWQQQNKGWPASTRANHLLGARFGERSRPYLTHMAKTLGRHFLQEAEAIWPEEFANTASHIVRNDFGRDNDIYPAFLMAHYVVERWREALLWSFIVASMGDDDDGWDEQRAWTALGGEPGKGVLIVTRNSRDTLRHLRESVLESGITSNTAFIYSSFDGYPYSALGQKGTERFPDFDMQSTPEDEHPGTQCMIMLTRCFYIPGVDVPKASEIFKHVAFQEIQCGDCIIDALMNQSGRLGLQAFLPDPGQRAPASGSVTKTTEASRSLPRLPMTSDWTTTDFTLRAVLGSRPDLTIRGWVEQALVRYRFVIGRSSLKFAMIQKPKEAKSLEMIGAEDAMICVNDDVLQGEGEVRATLKSWMGGRWPQSAGWEVPD